MKILHTLTQTYDSHPLKDKNILLCTHVTDATVYFVKALSTMGACVFYAPVDYSKNESSLKAIQKIKNIKIIEKKQLQKTIPIIDIIMEDGMRISKIIYDGFERFKLKEELFTIEQTTSGIRMFEKQIRCEKLIYPVINVAESSLKLKIENSLSTPE